MSFLTDKELERLIFESTTPLIIGLKKPANIDAFDSPIQPCSVDLTIDEIYLHPDKATDNEKEIPRISEHKLKVGSSAKVSTQEKFNLPDGYGAIVFAPARLTRRGVLIPDVGHVDPGFKGELRMTLINVGGKDITITNGQVVATVLIFALNQPVRQGFDARCAYVNKNKIPYEQGVKDIQYLAKDFLDIENRAVKAAKNTAIETLGESGWKYNLYTYFLPTIVGLLVSYGTYLLKFDSRVQEIATEVTVLKGKEGSEDTIKRIDKLSQNVEALQRELETVKKTMNKK